MTDGVGITKQDALPVAKRPNGYQTDSIRQVTSRAAAVQQDTSAEELKGLKRLNRILGQDHPLKDNVPRGFYLNIKI